VKNCADEGGEKVVALVVGGGGSVGRRPAFGRLRLLRSRRSWRLHDRRLEHACGVYVGGWGKGRSGRGPRDAGRFERCFRAKTRLVSLGDVVLSLLNQDD